jgi:predicted lipase
MKAIPFIVSIISLACGQYNPNIAKRNLEIAAATYCPNLEQWNCAHCVADVELYEVITGDTNIVILGDRIQNATVFAFRGSANIENWISNFEARFAEPYADANIKVHKGLYAEYMIYRDTLLRYLYRNNKIVVTGHSSGGALSMFFAYDIYKTQNVVAYSFGKPRIGNDAFADSASGVEHYRITHASDIVPHLPEEVLGYRHTNTEVWYPNDGIEYKLCATSEDESCGNSCAPVSCVSVDDHLRYMGVDIGSDAC